MLFRHYVCGPSCRLGYTLDSNHRCASSRKGTAL